MVSTKQPTQTADDGANRQHNHQDIDETTNAAGPGTNSAAADIANPANPPSASATSSANGGTANADNYVITGNVNTCNLGPGAYHVVPLAGAAAAAADGEGDEATTNPVAGANDLDDVSRHDIAVTATLVVEDDGGDDPNRNGSSNGRNERSNNSSAADVSSTLIAHATPVVVDAASGGHSARDASDGGSANGHDGHDEEAPVLSLVDQRVVDEHISNLKGEHRQSLKNLKGEHRQSLKRRTIVGAVLVLLAVIIVVAVTVPVVTNQRGEADKAVPSDASMEAEPMVGACGMTELKRRFESSSNSTEEQTKDGNPYEYYGMWSAVSGSTIVVGSPGTEGPGPDGKVHRLGRVHIFEGRQREVPNEEEMEDGESEWTWEEISTGALEPAERVTEYGLVASFGFRVALSDDVLAVTSFTDKAGFPGVGMVYVYRRNADDNTWVEEAIIVPPEDAMDDDVAMAVFGALVAVSVDTMAVASVLRDNARGAVYVYHRVVDATGTVTWQEEAKLEASGGMEGDEFGSSLAIDGNTIVAGSVWAMNDDEDIVGKAYVFSKNDEGSWVETGILTASGAQPNSEFGYFVAIVGDTIAVSAPFASRGGDEEPNGMVYIYRYDDADAVSIENSTWVETSMLFADDASEFGASLSMHGEYIVVGAPSAPKGGGIYLYGLEGDDWKLEKKFQYPDTVGFGRSVGISEQAVVVTDPIFTRNGMAQSGAAFAVDYLQSNKTLC